MSAPPEEPHLRAEPNILSPASPRPVHIPPPTNIPVLEMQMDVGFNQTEPHMSDPAMHNTDVRPDFWRDPNEPQQQMEETDHASPYSTGGEAMQSEDSGQEVPANEETADSEDTAQANATEPEIAQLSTSASIDEASGTDVAVQQNDTILPPTGPSLSTDPATGAASTQDVVQDQNIYNDPAQHNEAAQAFNANTVDVQALLDTLQTAPSASASASTAPQADGTNMNIETSFTPSSNAYPGQQQAPPPGVESTPMSASGLGAPPTSGLPPRPPPQEQPLIHPNYVHSQHIRDYHPHAAHPAFQPHARSGSQGGGNVADPNSRSYVPPVHSPSSAGGVLQGQQSGAPGAVDVSGGAYTASPTSAFPSGAANGHDALPSPSGAPSSNAYTPQQPSYAGSPTSATTAGQWAATPANMYNPAAAQGGTVAQSSYDSTMTNTPIESRRERKIREGSPPRPEDRPWDAEVQRKYDRFIEEERRYVSEGRWEQFPQGSRLFVGNLSSEKVTKRDIFHVFHAYGQLAQISIKQAYGFVQFLRTEDCMRALEAEQGTLIRDKRIHLEVSKPQKNRTQNTQQRRSRSPPVRQGSNVDRYVSGGSRAGNNRNDRRDGYRPGYRSPSPRGYRDRYDDRHRPRSRSPDYGRGARYRSPSPRRDVDDDLPLPKRNPRDVPDVQIIVLDSLDRDFISWVQRAFEQRSVRVDVLILSPRLSEQAVVRRQILEGVAAVVRLKRANQDTGKIGLQIFDRRGGVGNVTFEEYDGLDPNIAVELVLRARVTHGVPAPQMPPTPQQGYGGAGYGGQPGPQYGAAPPPPVPHQQQQYSMYGAPPTPYAQPPPAGYPPNYGHPPAPPQQQPQGVPPNLQSLITNMDPNNLQSLLGSMGTPQSASSNPYGATPTNSAVQQQLQANPALAGYLQQQQQQQQATGGGGQVNMQEILARLGSYQQR